MREKPEYPEKALKPDWGWLKLSPPTMIISEPLSSLKAVMMVTKMSLENKYLVNGDYFVIIASSLPPLLFTEHAANWL